MASTISAGTTTTTALVYSADTSGVLQLQTNGGTTALTLDTSQNATFAGKVASASSLQLATNGTTTAVTIDTSQNVGIGTTPSAWGSGRPAIEYNTTVSAYIANNNTGSMSIQNNSYYNGSVSVAKVTGAGSAYIQYQGGHYWYSMASVSAGATQTLSQNMTLDASGKLLVGTTTAFSGNGMSITSSQNTIWTNCTAAAQNAMVAQNSANSTGTAASLIAFNVGTAGGGTTVGSISYNGTTTVLNPTSDVRLKENIVDAGSALEKINSVRIRSFNWKSNNHFTDFGVIAQELVEVAPECVKIGGDEINEDGELQDPWCAQPYVLVPAMIKAIQELSAQVTTLQTQVTALKG